MNLKDVAAVFSMVMLVAVGILIGCVYMTFSYKETFRNSEFERGAMMALDYHFKNHEYPNYWIRQQVYLNPNFNVDSVLPTDKDLVRRYLDSIVVINDTTLRYYGNGKFDYYDTVFKKKIEFRGESDSIFKIINGSRFYGVNDSSISF